MDVALVIRHRLKDLGLEQRGLAAAAQVTESYVSQLLASKKAPPAPRRTDIYDKMEIFLKLPRGELARLAEIQRKEELRKKVADPAQPLFRESRELILRKCHPEIRAKVGSILERAPFGELERLVTQKLLDVAKGIAKRDSGSEKWVRLVARLSKRTHEQTRAMIRTLMKTDVFSASVENCVLFLEPLIESWSIDLETFGMEIAVNRKIAPGGLKRFEFVEREPERSAVLDPGLRQFLDDKSLSGDATEEEIGFLKMLKLGGRRPVPIYYYRELQNLRDPVHFRNSAQLKELH
jgi:transcriptional regulator with XRE-family HTH domain